MNRGARMAVWGVVWAALAAGPGCMLFDDYDEEYGSNYSSTYERERPPQVSEYPAPAGDMATPGVYTEGDRK